MRRGVENLREQNVLLFDGLLKITLSEAEARAGDLDRAVAILDEALTTTDRAGFRALEAELHRVRGEILLKCDPANPAPAEEAFQSAIAIREAAKHAQLRIARGVVAREALPIDGPPRGSARRPLVRARRLRADSRISGDRGGARAASGLTQADEVKAQASRRQRLTQLQIGLRQCALRGARLRRSWFSPTSSSPVAIRYDRFTSTPAIRSQVANAASRPRNWITEPAPAPTMMTSVSALSKYPPAKPGALTTRRKAA